MRLTAFPIALFAAACSIQPSFSASRHTEFTVPAAGVHTIDCSSHNGPIVVRGNAGATEVRVNVELTAYGTSQQEADARLLELDVAHRVADGTLILHGTPIATPTWGCSPGFAFTLEVPRDAALTLTTHNGRLAVDDVDGTVTLKTHNGEIAAHVGSDRVDLETHNGGVEFAASGTGNLSGRIESHNGGVEVAIGAGVATRVVAKTHNGRVKVTGAVDVDRDDYSRAEATFGDGDGRLEVSTHNGSVRLR